MARQFDHKRNMRRKRISALAAERLRVISELFIPIHGWRSTWRCIPVLQDLQRAKPQGTWRKHALSARSDPEAFEAGIADRTMLKRLPPLAEVANMMTLLASDPARPITGADARAPSCFKVQKSSRTARSRQHGLSFPDRGQVIFPDCAARAALKASWRRVRRNAGLLVRMRS